MPQGEEKGGTDVINHNTTIEKLFKLKLHTGGGEEGAFSTAPMGQLKSRLADLCVKCPSCFPDAEPTCTYLRAQLCS